MGSGWGKIYQCSIFKGEINPSPAGTMNCPPSDMQLHVDRIQVCSEHPHKWLDTVSQTATCYFKQTSQYFHTFVITFLWILLSKMLIQSSKCTGEPWFSYETSFFHLASHQGTFMTKGNSGIWEGLTCAVGLTQYLFCFLLFLCLWVSPWRYFL